MRAMIGEKGGHFGFSLGEMGRKETGERRDGWNGDECLLREKKEVAVCRDKGDEKQEAKKQEAEDESLWGGENENKNKRRVLMREERENRCENQMNQRQET